MRFEFATANRILFGPGTLKEVGAVAREFGGRALVVAGAHPARAEGLLPILAANGVTGEIFSVAGEPKITDVTAGVARGRQSGCDMVISFGGGSVMDAGKAIAAMMANEGDLMEYLEVIGRGRPLPRPPVPFIAIPTTAGTGTEVTRNAVLASPAHGVKVSLRSPLMLPRVALVDPELTFDLPPALTASTGLDALTQLIEPFVCSRANPMTDALCREGIQRVARALPRAFQHGRDIAAREDMCVASLFGGLALANAGLGAVHGFAAPIGGSFPAPHGAVCAALLPHVMRANLLALHVREPGSPALPRYAEIAGLVTGRAGALAQDGAQWVADLCATLAVRPLRDFGLQPADFPGICAKAAQASSMKANPIALTLAELTEILERAW